jgi:hypothetical protein
MEILALTRYTTPFLGNIPGPVYIIEETKARVYILVKFGETLVIYILNITADSPGLLISNNIIEGNTALI